MLQFVGHRIILSISGYDSEIPPPWFSDFFSRLESLNKCRVYLDFCILNYDSWVEGCLNKYTDGFRRKYRCEGVPDEYSVFDRELARSVPDDNRVNHIHGSVHFGGGVKDEDMRDASLCKWDKHILESSLDNQIFIKGGDEGLKVLTPVITGRNKSRCLCMEPYASYMYNLEGSMCLDDAMVVIGYGFGDEHVNRTIGHYGRGSGKRLVVVSPYSDWTRCRISELCGYSPEKTGSIWTSDDGMCVWFMIGSKALATEPGLVNQFISKLCAGL